MEDINFNFAALLVILTIVTGAIWAVDAIFFAPTRTTATAVGEQVERVRRPPAVVEFARSFFPVILVVLLLRSFVVEPFRIPSGSMIPTLDVGDFILVNKFAYGLRLPVIHTKVLDIGEPQRGDVTVFRFPLDPGKDFIKRIVGLPGDVVAYRDKQVFINGKPMPLSYLGPFDGHGSAVNVQAQLYREILGDVTHTLLLNSPREAGRDLRFKVPPHSYFVMGDNRDNSDDSRYWGFVPEGNLVGKAFLIWMSWDGVHNRPAFSRIGNVIH